MKAQTQDTARNEGKQFAALLGRMVQKQAEQDYESVSNFAWYFAIDVVGYSSPELAKAWTTGFVSQWMKTPTQEELSEQYGNGSITFQQFSAMIGAAVKAAIAAPLVDNSENS